MVKAQVRKQRDICVYINTKPLTSYETKEDNAFEIFFLSRDCGLKLVTASTQLSAVPSTQFHPCVNSLAPQSLPTTCNSHHHHPLLPPDSLHLH